MTRILPHQSRPLLPQVQPKRQEDFAEKLQSHERQGQPKSEHFATMKDSSASGSSSTVATTGSGSPALANPGKPGDPRMTEVSIPSNSDMGDTGCDGDLDRAADAGEICDDASMPATGLLSGILTWSRVYPEHLIASGYLSEIDVAGFERNTGSNPNPTRPGVDICAPSAGVLASLPDMDSCTAETLLALKFEGPAPPVVNAVAGATPGLGPETVSSQECDVTALADRFWAERMVRLTPGSNGRNTLWVRDYRLEEGDIDRVATELRQHHEREGGLVGRIVINGYEVWRAPDSEGER